VRRLGYKQDLEGMVSRTSNLTAVLVAFLAGCFGLIGAAASAGEKIEFSAPSPLLEVPHPEEEVSQDPMAFIRATLAEHRNQGGDMSGPLQPTFIIPLQKSQNRFGWKAPFEEDADQDDSDGLDLFAPKKASTQSKSANSSDTESDLSKDASWTRSGRDLSQLGTDALNSKDGGMDRERQGGGLDNQGVSDWFHELESHAKPNSERMQPAALTPAREGKEDLFYQQSYSDLSQPDPLSTMDPLHSSAYVVAKPPRDSLDESLGGPTLQQAMSPPSIPRAWEELPTAPRPQRPAAPRASFFSAPSRAPSAPAVLAFPKRPGDLFQ
jgi:hypothetical protein